MKRRKGSEKHVPNQPRAYAFCEPCGKALFPDRRTARKYIRAQFPGHHFSAYECPRGLPGWHAGKMPPAAARGDIDFRGSGYAAAPRERQRRSDTA